MMDGPLCLATHLVVFPSCTLGMADDTFPVMSPAMKSSRSGPSASLCLRGDLLEVAAVVDDTSLAAVAKLLLLVDLPDSQAFLQIVLHRLVVALCMVEKGGWGGCLDNDLRCRVGSTVCRLRSCVTRMRVLLDKEPFIRLASNVQPPVSQLPTPPHSIT